MTKKQRIRNEVRLAISEHALGANRTAALEDIRQKYWPGKGSTADLDALTVFDSYKTN